jgi:hypothetical protein
VASYVAGERRHARDETPALPGDGTPGGMDIAN